MATNEISILVKAEVKKAVEDLKKFEKGTKDAGEQADQSGNKTAGGFKKMGGAVAGVIAAITAFAIAAKKAYDIGDRLATTYEAQENALKKLAAIARTVGVSFETLKLEAVKLSEDGLMSMEESVSALSNLLSAGMGLPEAIKLLKVAKDNAAVNRQAHYELGEAVVVFTEGIKNENSQLTDSVGIQKNYAAVLEEGARALGKSTAELTKTEKARIIANGFIKEGAVFEGQAAKASESYAATKAKLSKALGEFGGTLGKAVLPAMRLVVGGLTDLARGAQTAFEWITRAQLSPDREAQKRINTLKNNIAEQNRLIASNKELIRTQSAFLRADEDVSTAFAAQIRQIADAEAYIQKLAGEILQVEKAQQDAADAAERQTQIAIIAKRENLALADATKKYASTTLADLIGMNQRATAATEAYRAKLEAVRTIIARAGSEQGKAYDEIFEKAVRLNVIQVSASEAENLATLEKIRTNEQYRSEILKQIRLKEDQIKAEQTVAEDMTKISKFLANTQTQTAQLALDTQYRDAVAAAQRQIRNKEELEKTLIELEKKYKEESRKITNDHNNKVALAVLNGAVQAANAWVDVWMQAQKTVLDGQLAALEQEEAARLESLNRQNQFTEEIAELEAERRQEQRDEQMAELEAELAAETDATKKAAIQKKIDKMLEEEAYQAQVNALKEQEKEREKQIALEEQKIKDDIAKKEAALKREAWIKERDAKIAMSIVNGAVAVVNSLASGIPPFNFIAAAATGIAAAAQTTLIASQPVPAFAEGGIVNGPQMILAGERGREAVLPNDLTEMLLRTAKGGGGGGNTYNITVQANDPISFNNQLKRRYGREVFA